MLDIRNISIGDEIPAYVREGTLQHWNRFAGANYEFADHHMDDAVGQHEGFEAAFAMGPLIHAYVHCLQRNWAGEDHGRIVRQAIQLRKPFLRGRTATFRGTVSSISEVGDEIHIDLDILAEDNHGALLVKGTATVALPGSAAQGSRDVRDDQQTTGNG